MDMDLYTMAARPTPLKTLMPRPEVMKQTAFLTSMILGMSLAGCAIIPESDSSTSNKPSATSTPKADAGKEPAQPLVQPAAPPAKSAPSAPRAFTPPEPPPIRPGECWVQAVINPKPVKHPLEIVVRDAVNQIKITPPMVELAWKKITVREGGVTYRVEPPVYKRITEKVLVRPEIRRSVVVPAVYEKRDVAIEIEAERTVLERCKVSSTRRSPETPVQTLCSRLIPAKTQTLRRNILVQPETTREVVEPAVYKEVSRWVIETPARVVPVDIAPESASIRVREVTQPEQIDEQQLPPEIRNLIATRYEGSPRLVFRRAVCDQELTAALVQDVQKALKKAGFDPGPVDGKFGTHSYRALLDYQRQNGLAHGALTYESLQHLGLRVDK